ncbi:MAG: hypothetical protein KKD31_17750 [Bacteroidetes bacterium]|nr:hypothetical protein [Bacteroidota bacterium]
MYSYNTATDLVAQDNLISPDWMLSSNLPTQVYKVGGSLSEQTLYNRQIGNKLYELTDHLGNVRVVISDKKYAKDINDNNVLDGDDYYYADVKTATDYYPYGFYRTRCSHVIQCVKQ